MGDEIRTRPEHETRKRKRSEGSRALREKRARGFPRSLDLWTRMHSVQIADGTLMDLVASFLTGPQLLKLGMTGTSGRSVALKSQVWSEILRRSFPTALRDLLTATQNAGAPETPRLIRLWRSCQALSAAPSCST